MKANPESGGPLIRLKLVWVVWLLFGFFFGLKTYLFYRLAAHPLRLSVLLLGNVVACQLFFLGTVPVLVFAERFPIRRRGWPARVSAHFAAGLAFSVVTGTLTAVIYTWEMDPSGVGRVTTFHLFRAVISGLDNKFFIYWSVVFVSHAAGYYSRYRREELRTAQVEAELARSQLRALKAQLRPHFLFNTLNAVTELVYDAPETADRAVTQLSELLRLSLRSDAGQEVALGRELEFLKMYTDIEQTLMRGRLTVRWDVRRETLGARVPSMILQPLVENSIRHGLSRRASGGSVRVSARREGGRLRLSVIDDGLGLPAAGGAARQAGLGLANTRERLKYLYGDAQRFETEETPGGGLTVHVLIPFRTSAGEETDEDSDADC
ncbi:MAG TPA: histidine kinase [Pyrinomonadaceae bacterium]|jgi:hypothetical protein